MKFVDFITRIIFGNYKSEGYYKEENNKVDTSINIVTTIFSSLTNVSIFAENGYYFKDELNTFSKTSISDLEFILHTDDYDDTYTISSNPADLVDSYIRYSRIYADADYFELNLSASETLREDVIEINVVNDKNSFKVSVIAQNTAVNDVSNIQTSTSAIYVVENNISMNNTMQNQTYSNNIKSISLKTPNDVSIIVSFNFVFGLVLFCCVV